MLKSLPLDIENIILSNKKEMEDYDKKLYSDIKYYLDKDLLYSNVLDLDIIDFDDQGNINYKDIFDYYKKKGITIKEHLKKKFLKKSIINIQLDNDYNIIFNYDKIKNDITHEDFYNLIYKISKLNPDYCYEGFDIDGEDDGYNLLLIKFF